MSWLAYTQAEALEGIRSLVADVVEDMLVDDEPLPPAPAPQVDIDLRPLIESPSVDNGTKTGLNAPSNAGVDPLPPL